MVYGEARADGWSNRTRFENVVSQDELDNGRFRFATILRLDRIVPLTPERGAVAYRGV
jgi:hypothetical protein